MNCWFCNATITDTRLLATTLHFWARCCPGCRDKYGEKDDLGNFTYQAEAKHV